MSQKMWIAEPHEPRRHAGHPEAPEVGHGPEPPDRRELPVVAERERRERHAVEAGEDRPRRVRAALDAALGHAGHVPPGFPGDRREVADDEDLGMTRDREVVADDDPSGPVRRGAGREREGPAEGLDLDPGGPQDRACGDAVRRRHRRDPRS